MIQTNANRNCICNIADEILQGTASAESLNRKAGKETEQENTETGNIKEFRGNTEMV